MIQYLKNTAIIWIPSLIVLALIGWRISYEYYHPCVYGHNEEQWQTQYCTDAQGNMWVCGGYYQDVFICDCRTTRDSMEYYGIK